jgi:hypothetical protein
MTRRSDDAELLRHLAYTQLVTRTVLTGALDIIFAHLAANGPVFSRVEDAYGAIEQEQEIIKKTLIAEIARRFGKRRGRPGAAVGYFTGQDILREMARLTSEGVGINKAAKKVHQLLAAQQSLLFKALRRRFPGDRQMLESVRKLPKADAIASRWRRHARD